MGLAAGFANPVRHARIEGAQCAPVTPLPSCPPFSPQDQVSKDKALQSMASMSSAQIVSASVLQNKLSPPPPLPQAVFSAAPRVRTAPRPPHGDTPGWWDTMSCTGGRGMLSSHSQPWWQCRGSLLSAAGEEGNFGSGESQKPLTLPCAVSPVLEWAYPRTAWTLSGVSTDPSIPGTRQGPALARGCGIPGVVT